MLHRIMSRKLIMVKNTFKIFAHQIQDLFESPLLIASLHRKTFQNIWLPSCLKFTGNGNLVYHRNIETTVSRLVEITWVLIYGLAFCPFVLHRHQQFKIGQSNQFLIEDNANKVHWTTYDTYKNVSWIHKSLYFLAIISGFGTIILDQLLDRHSHALETSFNALLQLKHRFTQGTYFRNKSFLFITFTDCFLICLQFYLFLFCC